MEDLSNYFNNCSVTPGIEMNEILASVNEIDQEIKINNLGMLTVINWIQRNPNHCFPKRKREWINTINGNRHLKRVRIFNINKRRTEVFTINGETILEQLLNNNYFYQIKFRIYCNRQRIEKSETIYRCGKRNHNDYRQPGPSVKTRCR